MSDNEYIDKLGKREERIRAQDTAALIEEFNCPRLQQFHPK